MCCCLISFVRSTTLLRVIPGANSAAYMQYITGGKSRCVPKTKALLSPEVGFVAVQAKITKFSLSNCKRLRLANKTLTCKRSNKYKGKHVSAENTFSL